MSAVMRGTSSSGLCVRHRVHSCAPATQAAAERSRRFATLPDRCARAPPEVLLVVENAENEADHSAELASQGRKTQAPIVQRQGGPRARRRTGQVDPDETCSTA